MRRDADREERNARLLAGVVLAAMLVLLSGIIHLLYHREYAETDTPNDCFAVSAATGENALPKIVCLTFDDGPSKNTRPILEILDKEQVPATFFVCAQTPTKNICLLLLTLRRRGIRSRCTARRINTPKFMRARTHSGRTSERCARRWSRMWMWRPSTGCVSPAAAQTQSATATAETAS